MPVCLTQLNTEEKISVLPEDIASQRGYQDIVELFNKKKYLVLMDSINALALEPTHDAARHIAIKKLQAYAVQTYKNNQLSFKERYNLLKTASTQLTSLDQMTSQLMQIESKYTGKNRHRKKSVSHIKTAVENAYKRYLSDEDVISTEALLLEDILTIKKAVDLHHSTEGTRARFFGKSTTESRLSTIIRETLDSGPKKH